MGSSDANRMLLIAGDLLVAQETDMALFTITEHHLVNTMYGVSMEIKFKRKIMSEMMTTYLPSVLLMLITFATTFFKPLFFEAALSVNLTTMLVMTTIFMSKMESLPPTSDIKMIDIWLIFCQLVPFAQVVLLTAMEYLRESEQEKKKKEKQGKRKRKREKKMKGEKGKRKNKHRIQTIDRALVQPGILQEGIYNLRWRGRTRRKRSNLWKKENRRGSSKQRKMWMKNLNQERLGP